MTTTTTLSYLLLLFFFLIVPRPVKAGPFLCPQDQSVLGYSDWSTLKDNVLNFRNTRNVYTTFLLTENDSGLKFVRPQVEEFTLVPAIHL
jgi:hypothetical protein